MDAAPAGYLSEPEMRVVVAHGRAGERRRFRRVLAEAGHDVAGCDCVDAALERCLGWERDGGVGGEARAGQDTLVEPVHDAELVTRVHAAGRTKGLQEEIVAQAKRLEALLFEDPLTGLPHRRFTLPQLSGMVSGARRHDR